MVEYFIGNMWLAWLIVSLACLLFELLNGDLYVICFAIGALVSVVLAACDAPFWVQAVAWGVASVLCITFLRPSLVKKLHNGFGRSSNADALVGQTGRVIKTIPGDGHGYVRIAGDEWRSVSADGKAITAGDRVRVVKRDSTILTVKQLEY